MLAAKRIGDECSHRVPILIGRKRKKKKKTASEYSEARLINNSRARALMVFTGRNRFGCKTRPTSIN